MIKDQFSKKGVEVDFSGEFYQSTAWPSAVIWPYCHANTISIRIRWSSSAAPNAKVVFFDKSGNTHEYSYRGSASTTKYYTVNDIDCSGFTVSGSTGNNVYVTLTDVEMIKE